MTCVVCSCYCFEGFPLAKRSRSTVARTLPQFERIASHQTQSAPQGVLSVLSSTTVAFGTVSATVEVWDWVAGRLLQSLGGFSQAVYTTARLPDGQVLGAGLCGQIRTGHPENWATGQAFSNGAALLGAVTSQDGLIVTADANCQVKLWRNGSSQVLPVSCYPGFPPQARFAMRPVAAAASWAARSSHMHTPAPAPAQPTYTGNPLAIVGSRLVVIGSNNDLMVAE